MSDMEFFESQDPELEDEAKDLILAEQMMHQMMMKNESFDKYKDEIREEIRKGCLNKIIENNLYESE